MVVGRSLTLRGRKVTAVGEQFLTVEIANGVNIKLQKHQVAQLLPKGTVKGA